MTFLCEKKWQKQNKKTKPQFDPKYSLKHVISVLYETSLAGGSEGLPLSKLPLVSSNVLKKLKLLASASNAASVEIFFKS